MLWGAHARLNRMLAGQPIPAIARRAGVIAAEALRPARATPWNELTPLREILLSPERLEDLARDLAREQLATAHPARAYSLPRRVNDNAKMLVGAYRRLVAAAGAREAVSPAAEWIIDNFHVVERQVREIRNDLPPGYYRRLPMLAAGRLRGYPRILGAVWAYVAHTDSHFNPDVLCRFLCAYQQVQPLLIGELWAVPITLRALLVENLRRFAEVMLLAREARERADALANHLLSETARGAHTLRHILAGLSEVTLSDPFVVQLAQRLRDQDISLAPALAWLDQRLAFEKTSIDEVVQAEQQREINAAITVRNIITSMRLITDVDWRDLFERMSLVDATLANCGDYAVMDFPTRDLYRAAIERIARGSKRSEIEVARSAAAAAANTKAAGEDRRRTDVGYYLIANGRAWFEEAVGYRPAVAEWPGRIVRGLGISGYVTASVTVCALLLWPPLLWLSQFGADWRWLCALGLLGAFPASDAAISLVNYLMTRGLRATLLPGMELSGGIFDEHRTLVVVPTMLTSAQTIKEQIERLEAHYLSGPKGEVYFALLSDWVDAAAPERDDDEALLMDAKSGIARLNAKYGPASSGERFLLLHRRRVWTKSEAKWIGWERKRGKLSELNELLRGATNTTFIAIDGKPPCVPPDVRYVITLDADTRLTADSIRRLIGKMAHPLNRPRFDQERQRVLEGYGILQPRVTPSMPIGHEATPFLRVFSNMAGIDPYAAAASDIYQDLLGEGSYTGKGIYDVDAFRASLVGRVPASSLLSHDLFEGAFARAGLVSDIEFVEQFPTRYDAAALRHHRWARGDWQLLPWILGVRRALNHNRKAGLPMVGRWKMLDNLRRTLSAPAATLSLLLAFASPPPASWAWVAFVSIMIATPPLVPVLALGFPRWRRTPVRRDLRAIGADIRVAILQWALSVTFLAHQAWLMADAALRTVVRLVSGRNLLEWMPAAQARLGGEPGLRDYYRYMAGAVLIGAGGLLLAFAAHEALAAPLAFALLWSLSPAIAVWISRSPQLGAKRRLSQQDIQALRIVARKTWRFFENFVTAESNWLPPDNFQEHPEPLLAQRTSPTNIGLYLLSTVAAHDLGWTALARVADRLEATLATLKRLDRFRGHFYNWYDTRDLRALAPQYVSSVDSGNLAGHLIVVANACQQWCSAEHEPTRPALDLDALAIAREEASRLRAMRRMPTLAWDDFERRLEALALSAASNENASVQQIEDVKRLADATVDTAAAHAIAETDRAGDDLVYWLRAACGGLNERAVDAATFEQLRPRFAALAEAYRSMAYAMDFGFLLDRQRLLLSIGYRGSDGVLDPSCYDLLASEARLASLLAIAKGDAPPKHWFRMSHAVTLLPNGPALISWSGSMFEYLMPSLVMQEPTHSLLERTNRLVVERQIQYGRRLNIPWGVSESAYNARDLDSNYQYSNFGVPGLGLKRGLADNVVVAPYATALAAMISPKEAQRNFERMAALGAVGRYGFYEAIDFTPERLQAVRRYELVRSFMAHHQGMTISAIANVLCNGALRARFHAEPAIQASDLLLQERMPIDILEPPAVVAAHRAANRLAREPAPAHRTPSPWSASPATHLLSNGRYAVMLTAAGAGYSCWNGIALTRWREDASRDDFGVFFYLRDINDGSLFCSTLQPACRTGDTHRVLFEEGRAEFSCHSDRLSILLDVIVSEEDDAEVRRLSVTNTGGNPREIEVTSYVELALAPPAADQAHPAFSKMFVEIEYLPRTGALLARRRRRGPDEPEVWVGHLVVTEGEVVGGREFECDRARFIGRNRDLRQPIAVVSGAPLSGSSGATLDPIFSLRRRIRVAPGETVRLHFWTVAAASRSEALDLIDKHNDLGGFARAEALAWTQAQMELHHIGVDRAAAAVYQRLAGHLIYANPAMRPSSQLIGEGRGPQSQLWSMGISGDLPIMLVQVSEIQQLNIVKEALRAFEYLGNKRLAFDLVIMNEREASYLQDLQNAIEEAVRASDSHPRIGAEPPAGHIYVLRADLVGAAARAALASAARIVLRGDRGQLAEQLSRRPDARHFGRASLRGTMAALSALQPPIPSLDLNYFNGLGGFSPEGKEYVVNLTPGQTTPAPWINVIANANFGFHVSETGASFTWSQNSRERQLTPWFNDPVCDPTGQAFYVRDRDTGQIFSPTASPVYDEASVHTAVHAHGYSRFTRRVFGLELSLVEYVPVADPVKISRLRISNASSGRRRLTVTAYVEWVLGASRERNAPHVATTRAESGAIFATNHWNADHAERVAFADMGGRQQSWTGDRREFIGRNGSLSSPAALAVDAPLSGRLGAGLDPCAALQTQLELAPGEHAEIVVLLGDAAHEQEAERLVARYRSADLDAVLDEVRRFWAQTLGAVTVKTPDKSFDLMINGWLLYQTLSCRMWARAGFYQSSGAYGFRDQVQDAMALALASPQLARDHLLRASARQFAEGDVQHWWLPHSGQGVRTRIADDRVWLPFAVAHYVSVSGDHGVLDEEVAFLQGQTLAAGETEVFFRPQVSDRRATLYEHCALALDTSMKLGAHGAPLIGGGDWNDGFNRVGQAGHGESVWLGWLLYAALSNFAPLAEARADVARAAAWRQHALALKENLDREAWDGEWYRRAWYDDGAPIGSAASEECRIDSIAQSWAVLSGAGDPQKARRAMMSVERDLVRPQEGIALLFGPPFDRTTRDPGYIKAYPPGIRENGGQYTHGAAWSVMALAALGEGDKASALYWMLNPINHTRTRADVHRYRVEPYVMAADVYSSPEQIGRGGWTWYTGSAGLMYRAGIESILGLRVENGRLRFAPCIPKSWPGFELQLRLRSCVYDVKVANTKGVCCGVARLSLDGVALEEGLDSIPIEAGSHQVEIELG